jgi:hypothetical protein
LRYELLLGLGGWEKRLRRKHRYVAPRAREPV